MSKFEFAIEKLTKHGYNGRISSLWRCIFGTENLWTLIEPHCMTSQCMSLLYEGSTYFEPCQLILLLWVNVSMFCMVPWFSSFLSFCGYTPDMMTSRCFRVFLNLYTVVVFQQGVKQMYSYCIPPIPQRSLGAW